MKKYSVNNIDYPVYRPSEYEVNGIIIRDLEAQVLENQKKSIKNEQDIKAYKTSWQSGYGREAIQQIGNHAHGANAIATGYMTESGLPFYEVASEGIQITFEANPNGGYTFRFSDPNATAPITYIAPYRVYCSSYRNSWIGFSGPYDATLGFDVPDLTSADIVNIELDNYIDEYFIYSTAEPDEESQITGTTTEGYYTLAVGDYSHAEGGSTLAMGERSHAEGSYTKALGFGSHAEGVHTYTDPLALFAHAEGGLTKAIGERSHAEGSETEAIGWCAHSEGGATSANANYSHAEGQDTHAYGLASHTEGRVNYAEGEQAHVEGYNNRATGNNAHAEGESGLASGRASHAEGFSCDAKGLASHAEGYDTTANGESSHVGGRQSVASQYGSFLHGWNLRDSRWYQAVVGLYNEVPTVDNGEQFIVGCGNANQRANAFVAGSSATDGKYVKIGNTKLTEQALTNLIDLIQPYTITGNLEIGQSITLPYTGNEMANHLNFTIRQQMNEEYCNVFRIYGYYNDSDEVQIQFDGSSYVNDGGVAMVLHGYSSSNQFTVLDYMEV